MRSVFLGSTKHIPIVYDADTLAYLRENAGLCDTIFSKKDVLEAPERFADTEFIFSTWGMPSFTEEEIKVGMDFHFNSFEVTHKLVAVFRCEVSVVS